MPLGYFPSGSHNEGSCGLVGERRVAATGAIRVIRAIRPIRVQNDGVLPIEKPASARPVHVAGVVLETASMVAYHSVWSYQRSKQRTHSTPRQLDCSSGSLGGGACPSRRPYAGQSGHRHRPRVSVTFTVRDRSGGSGIHYTRLSYEPRGLVTNLERKVRIAPATSAGCCRNK